LFRYTLCQYMNTNCNNCTEVVKKPKGRLGIFSFFILVILPKCPFCIMAFTSTAMLCGEGINMEVSKTYNSNLTILITAVLGLITLASLILNRKGKRTWYALLLSIVGLGCLLFSVVKYGGQPLYYTGIVLVFFGVWLNGSLLWFLRNAKTVSLVGSRDYVG